MQQSNNQIKQAIVLAGGFGTRLKSVVQDIPKPMASVNDRPFLEYVLTYLASFGIQKVVLSVGYKSELIEEHFGSEYQNMKILYAVEKDALGTGGGIAYATSLCDDAPIVVVNGDTFFEADINDMAKTLENSDIVLALKPMTDFDRYGVVELNDSQRIIAFQEKQYRKEGLINGGIYCFQKRLFKQFDLPKRFSFEQDFLEKYIKELQMKGCIFNGKFIDIGIPTDYNRAGEFLKEIIL